MELIHSGKVRDVYSDRDDVIIVASNRISVFDTVLNTEIPDKGFINTALSTWWFDRVTDIAPVHFKSVIDVPAEFHGRAVRCIRLQMIPVECVVRGYMAGSALISYNATSTVSDHPLPRGLVEASRLPEPIFTPTTKARAGNRDEPLTFEQLGLLVGVDDAASLRQLSLALYTRASEIAACAGIIIADTKFEFGKLADGAIVLADEILTPDSSRFWRVETWQPGRHQRALDKQFLRDWVTEHMHSSSAGLGVRIPSNIAHAMRQRYIEAFESITGEKWLPPGDYRGELQDEQ